MKTPGRMNRVRRRAHSIPQTLEWAEDAAGRCARITAIGSHSLLVENHTGLRAFSQELVRLDTRAGALCVSGSGLTLRDVRPGALIIRGRISRVELPCAGGDPPDEG